VDRLARTIFASSAVRRDFFFFARLDNRACDELRFLLFAEHGDDARQFALFEFVDDIRSADAALRSCACRAARRSETRIRARLRQAASRRRRSRTDTVHLIETVARRNLQHLGEIRFDHRQTPTEFADDAERAGNRARIAIEAEHAAIGCFQATHA
jgi:hypothetical protein